MACGSCWPRGRIEAAAAGLHHSHGNMVYEPRLRPVLTAMPEPYPTEWGQGSNLHLHGYLLGLFPLSHNGNSSFFFFLIKV